MSERNEKALEFLKGLDIKTSLGGFDRKSTLDSLRALSDLYEEILKETVQACDDRCAKQAEEQAEFLVRQNTALQELRQQLDRAGTELRRAQAEAAKNRAPELDAKARLSADKLLSDAKAAAVDITEKARRNAAEIKKQADIEALRRKAAAEDSLRYIKEERANIATELALIQEQLSSAILMSKAPEPTLDAADPAAPSPGQDASGARDKARPG